ncbi:MAG: hypothetical protein RSE00_02395 [Clostridia bacterium]
MVGIYKCSDYDEEKISLIIDKIFKIQGFDKLITPGINVALKPNMLALRDEKKAITTNKVLILCVAKKIISLGGKCVLCDSPAGNYEKSTLESMYKGLRI